MEKTLVTHINPHLDDLAAIWLFKKFNPEFKDVRLEFLKATSKVVTWEGKEADTDPEIIHFGIGGGKYDEHKGDIGECATSLVWKDIENKVLDEIEKKALEEIVKWVTLEDTGKLPLGEYSQFSVPAFIRPNDNSQEGSSKACQLCSEILDRILKVLKNQEKAKKDWESKVEFDTKFGKTIAVASESVDRSFCKNHSGDLFLMYGDKKGYVQFFTPFEIDLEPIYKKMKELDPEADWYLHHSHHMVICGSGTAPDSKKTKLTYEELIQAIKNI